MRTRQYRQREAAAAIPQQPQAQYGLDEQAEILRIAANRLGLYDAADWLGDLLAVRSSTLVRIPREQQRLSPKKS